MAGAAGSCTATKKDGQPCSGKAIGSTGLCIGHQPRAPKAPKIDAQTVNAGVQHAAASVSSGVDPDAQKKLHAVLVGSLGLCCVFIPYNYRPMQNELESFLLPLERIWLRHSPGVGEINEDVTDALAAAVVAVNFAMRVYLVPRYFAKPVTGPAADGAAAPGAAAYTPRPADPTPTAVPAVNGHREPAGIGSSERGLEAMLSRIHSSTISPDAPGRRFDAGDPGDGDSDD